MDNKECMKTWWSALRSTSLMNCPSIFKKSNWKSLRYRKDMAPGPKSAYAKPTPRCDNSRMNGISIIGSRIAEPSVISKISRLSINGVRCSAFDKMSVHLWYPIERADILTERYRFGWSRRRLKPRARAWRSMVRAISNSSIGSMNFEAGIIWPDASRIRTKLAKIRLQSSNKAKRWENEIEERSQCGWHGQDPIYCAYHDTEWCVPETDSGRFWKN